MLANKDDARVKARINELIETLPVGRPFLDAIERDDRPFDLLPDGLHGFEFQPRTNIDGRPNRAILKLFEIEDGPMEGLSAVFFYKKSRVPFSRDRFSYGVCVITSRDHDAKEIQEWLDYAAGGFDPESPPHGLRKAFTFNIPD